jgi:hypothetical protein
MSAQTKVIIVQTDNRLDPLPYPFEYIPLSIEVNKKICLYLGYEYQFIPMIPEHCEGKHPSYGKIPVVYEFIQTKLKELENTNHTCIMVFLDTDAWIQNPHLLQDLVQQLSENTEKHGCFSRDPYIRKNTFVNSGSFLLKIDDCALKMYEALVKHVSNHPEEWNQWPWDQISFSQYIYENRDNYSIFVPDILNSGYGKVLRHNWNKCSIKMREDLYSHLCNPILENDQNSDWKWESVLDDKEYPNPNETGYEYLDFK